MSTLLTVGITVVLTLTYVAGAKFFLGGNPGIGSWLAFLFSPITVPLGLLILIIVYP